MNKHYEHIIIPQGQFEKGKCAIDHPFEEHPDSHASSSMSLYKNEHDKWGIFKSDGTGENPVIAALAETHFSSLAQDHIDIETAHNRLAVTSDDPKHRFGIASKIYCAHGEKSNPFYRLPLIDELAPKLSEDGKLYVGNPADPTSMHCSARAPQYSLGKLKLDKIIPYLESKMGAGDVIKYIEAWTYHHITNNADQSLGYNIEFINNAMGFIRMAPNLDYSKTRPFWNLIGYDVRLTQPASKKILPPFAPTGFIEESLMYLMHTPEYAAAVERVVANYSKAVQSDALHDVNDFTKAQAFCERAYIAPPCEESGTVEYTMPGKKKCRNIAANLEQISETIEGYHKENAALLEQQFNAAKKRHSIISSTSHGKSQN